MEGKMMNNLTRRKVVSAAVVSSVVGLASCGGPSTDRVERPQLTGSIRITTFHGGPPGSVAMAKTMQAFTSRYPNVKAELITISSDYWTKLGTMINSGDQPDALNIGPFEANSQFRLGNLLSLKTLLAKEQSVARDLVPNGLVNFRVGGQPDGEVVVMPEFWTPYVIFFNKAMFRETGVETPMDTFKKNPDQWNFDYLLELSKRMSRNSAPHEASEQSRWGFQVNFHWTNWLPWMWAHKGEFLSKDGKSTTITSAECVGAIQYIRDLVWRHHVAPSAQAVPQFRGVHEGKVAMVWNGGFDVARLRDAQIDFGIAPPPKGPGGRFSPENAAGLGIHPKSKNQDATWAFIKTRLDPEIQKALFGEVGYNPVSKAAMASVQVDPAFLEAAKGSRPYEAVRTQNWTEIGAAVLRHWPDFVNTDKRSVREGVQAIATEVNAILSK
jgi:multiple sugar transport system substrate-binding protein